MRLGAVISTAGGLHNVFRRAHQVGCDSLMLFTKNNRQWDAPPIPTDQLSLWFAERDSHPDLWPLAAHASYLINIASTDDALWLRSYQALRIEAERAFLLEIPTLTFHPGSHTNAGEEAGLARIVDALDRLLEEMPANGPTICLETMAGQGTNLGYRFEQIEWVLSNTEGGERLGVCFDPCHVFVAGYDLRTAETYEATMAEFDRVIGLGRLRCFHLNDSKNGLGSRKDRHTHIGEGEISLAGFSALVNDPRFSEHPAHLETPTDGPDDEGAGRNAANLQVLRSLLDRHLAAEREEV